MSLGETVLRWAGTDYGWGAVALAGDLEPGECVLVRRFEQPLLDGLACVAGLGLFSIYDDALSDAPWSEVRYGSGSACGPGLSDVGAPGPDERIELVDGEWIVAKGAESTCRQKPPVGDVIFRIPPTSCPQTSALSPAQLDKLCLAHPFGRPPACEQEPASEVQCEHFIGMHEDCGITTCEYIACADAMAAADVCGTPEECEAIAACDKPSKPVANLPITICAGIESTQDEAGWCEAHPWGRATECGGSGPSEVACADMLDLFEGCGVTQCEFAACAAALAVADCGESPEECAGISSCTY